MTGAYWFGFTCGFAVAWFLLLLSLAAIAKSSQPDLELEFEGDDLDQLYKCTAEPGESEGTR